MGALVVVCFGERGMLKWDPKCGECWELWGSINSSWRPKKSLIASPVLGKLLLDPQMLQLKAGC